VPPLQKRKRPALSGRFLFMDQAGVKSSGALCATSRHAFGRDPADRNPERASGINLERVEGSCLPRRSLTGFTPTVLVLGPPLQKSNESPRSSFAVLRPMSHFVQFCMLALTTRESRRREGAGANGMLGRSHCTLIFLVTQPQFLIKWFPRIKLCSPRPALFHLPIAHERHHTTRTV
jgi:hypothetical protein